MLSVNGSDNPSSDNPSMSHESTMAAWNGLSDVSGGGLPSSVERQACSSASDTPGGTADFDRPVMAP